MKNSHLLTLNDTRNLVAKLGLRPKKKLGQNFLVDKNIAQRVIALSEITEEDTVIEIGPGLGAITGAILTKGATVFAIEADNILHGFLSNSLALEFPSNLKLLKGDAVKEPLAGFKPTPGVASQIESVKIVSNLPYAISSPWMNSVMEGPLPSSMTLMLQKETADRFTASIDSRDLGLISIQIKSTYILEKRAAVSRRCFYPKPDVDSYLCRFHLKPRPYVFSKTSKKLIRKIFTQRRKQIGGICRNQPMLQHWLQALLEAKISHRTRPEAIPLKMWQELDRLLCIKESDG